MPNPIFRNRMVNNISYIVQEARNAPEIGHPGLEGRIRELCAEKLFRPMLPLGFEVGTGKVVDSRGQQSDEMDLVIYNRSILPAIMYSERDGVFPIESTYYALEIKTRATATNVKDAIRKGKSLINLDFAGKQESPFKNRSRSVFVLFCFGSDLVGSSSELDRYMRFDPDAHEGPVIKAMCVIGHGYWWHDGRENKWLFHPPSQEGDEIIDLVSGIVNTVVSHPPSQRVASLGSYLMERRPVLIHEGPAITPQ